MYPDSELPHSDASLCIRVVCHVVAVPLPKNFSGLHSECPQDALANSQQVNVPREEERA